VAESKINGDGMRLKRNELLETSEMLREEGVPSSTHSGALGKCPELIRSGAAADSELGSFCSCLKVKK